MACRPTSASWTAGWRSPASPRPYTGTLPPIEYPGHYIPKRVTVRQALAEDPLPVVHPGDSSGISRHVAVAWASSRPCGSVMRASAVAMREPSEIVRPSQVTVPVSAVIGRT